MIATADIYWACAIIFIFFLIKKFFEGPPGARQPPIATTRRAPPAPIVPRAFTMDEIKTMNGKGEEKRLAIVIKGKVYDVSRASSMYGPSGGPNSGPRKTI
eukprot:TRINITY_DN2267_c0_g3_i2.p1 TRINITY_DN2267_c0_g3~~TRINITY_DN2267_c0_g3_i2.p1  ORF type:complete len:101 (-),score=34.77 TRINITY_DN2267_c0_g3_i2:252-554(-)